MGSRLYVLSLKLNTMSGGGHGAVIVKPGSRRPNRAALKPPIRLIKKNGRSNITRSNIPMLRESYIRDISNTLVNSRWRWTVISLSSSFILSWVGFAIAWMIISKANGDLDPEHPSTRPCLSGIERFGGFVMFSMETQQTIGYGSRSINHYCPEGTFLMCFQIILGCAICGAMVSIVNAKMVRPLQMASKNLFSKHALISMRDGTLCLIFRVRDEHGRYSMGTGINAYLVQSRPKEPFLKSFSLEPHGILIWPLEVVHKITSSSPFWDLSAKELITKRFEIIATMTGTSSVTGQCSTTRTSYLSSEIQWGHRFKPCVFYSSERDKYYVDHSRFNATEEVLTPLCSAERLMEVISDMELSDDGRFPLSDADEDERSLYDNLDESLVVEEEEEEEVTSRWSRIGLDIRGLLESLKNLGDYRETQL